MDIEIKETETKGSAFITENNKTLAQMTYIIDSPKQIIIDHTEVDISLKGKGIGKKLLMVIVEKARKEQLKIVPVCPFVKAIFEKDKSIGDVT